MTRLDLHAQVLLIDEFVERFVDVSDADETLIAVGEAWASALDPSLSTTARRLVRDLVSMMVHDGPPEARRTARAGLAWLAHATLDPGQKAASQAQTYVLSLLAHRARLAAGAVGPLVAPPVEPTVLAEATRTWEAFKVEPLAPDAELVQRFREWAAGPLVAPEALAMRRLVRSATFLCDVLEHPQGWSDDNLASARAGLSYLLLSSDAVDDKLGLAGYLDDAHVLDLAVRSVEPSREVWLRLVETAGLADQTLAGLAVDVGAVGVGGVDVGAAVPVPIGADVLVSAALLCEPYIEAPDPFESVLFLPTTGAVAVALALVAVVDLLASVEAGERSRSAPLSQLLRSAWVRSEARCVVLVCPPDVAETWVDTLEVQEGRAVDLLPVARIEPDGRLVRWSARSAAREPLLVVASSLPDAARFVERAGLEVWCVLVDQRSAAGAEAARPAERPAPDGPVFETRRAAELEVLEDVALSMRLKVCRVEMAQALARLGPGVVSGLPDLSPSAARGLGRLLAQATGGDCSERVTAIVDDESCRAVIRAGRNGELSDVAPADLGPGLARLEAALAEADRVVSVLVGRHMPLAHWMARRYANHPSHADIVQEACLGLMHAARKYNHDKGARFGAYAAWWVRQGVEAWLSRHTRTIRIPVTTLQRVRWAGRSERELKQTLGRDPTTAEVASHMGVEPSRLRRYRTIGHDLERGCIALDEPSDDDGGRSLGETLVNDQDTLPVEALSNRQLVGEAMRLLEDLSEREAEVLRLRFGLGQHDPHTLSEVADLLGVSRERVRQIELRALGRLRHRAQHLGVRP